MIDRTPASMLAGKGGAEDLGPSREHTDLGPGPPPNDRKRPRSWEDTDPGLPDFEELPAVAEVMFVEARMESEAVGPVPPVPERGCGQGRGGGTGGGGRGGGTGG